VNVTDRSNTGRAPSRAGSPAVALLLGAWLLALRPAATAGETTPKSASPTASAPAPSLPVESSPLPELLSQTGLYRAGSTSEVASSNWTYSPQYPLWSDGALKRRWIGLPQGTQIDASNPEEWVFPVGTRFWKEFDFGGERVETRYIERLSDGTYSYASYVWDRTLGDARLAPQSGLLGVCEITPGVRHDVPSRGDCRVCHEGRATPILGFSALQLSPDRDRLAPHAESVPAGAVNLRTLLDRDLLVNQPQTWLTHAPRIDAPSATARAAFGYLYGNCAHCHNAHGSLAKLGLVLDPTTAPQGYRAALASVVHRASTYRLPGTERSARITPGKPDQSALWFRMQSRFAAAQMPPLGTKLVDRDAVRLLDRFIHQL
jgi:hypothetical protein